MAGVLTRVGLDELFGPAVLGVTSANGETFPDWFSNAWGSFMMGFLVPMRQSSFFASRSWLYVGLTTGYCGCTTTFSSWNQDAASLVVSSADVVTFLLILFDGVAAPLLCFIIGRHTHDFLVLILKALKRRAKRRKPAEAIEMVEMNSNGFEQGDTPAVVVDEVAHELTAAVGEETKGKERMENDDLEASNPSPDKSDTLQQGQHKKREDKHKSRASYWRVTYTDVVYCILLSSGLVLLCLLWLLLIEYGGVTNRYIWISCLFAPFGAMLRYMLSRYNAWRRCARFPLFTFLVNVVGSIGLALAVISGDLRGYSDTDIPGYTLRGFEVGFFGSLTTVSTFIGELYALTAVPYAYIYCIASLGTAQAALILINGLYLWVG